MSRVTGVVILMVFAVVAMSGAFAANSHTRQGAPSDFIAASPSATPPARKEADNIVGTCNTAKGCEALKDACKSLKKHSFKETDSDGSLGVCLGQPDFYLKNTNSGGVAKQPHKTRQLMLNWRFRRTPPRPLSTAIQSHSARN